MTRVLRSANKKAQSEERLSSKLSVSKKSKTIKTSAKKIVKVKNEDKQKNGVLYIDSIISNIFAYCDYKDFLEFNTVCKKWKDITNPIIHKTIKLYRNWDIVKRIYGKKVIYDTKKQEVDKCISHNAQYAPFVKEFKYNHDLEPRRAIRVFETFRFICKLTIEQCNMGQGQFLGMIFPLNQLQELTINTLTIDNTYRRKFYKEGVQLPSSLKKLRVYLISLVGNTDKFVKTINSHSNLVEFSINSHTYSKFLEPFYKPYPTLLNFEFNSDHLSAHQSLLGIFEHNSQLIYLKLALRSWSSELISRLNSHLINLEELKLYVLSGFSINYTEFVAEFSQPTKIKKIIFDRARLGDFSLNSILVNCPQLEELDLNTVNYYNRNNLVKFNNLPIYANLKNLSFDCYGLSEGVFDTILSKCPHLNELKIKLPAEWKEALKSVYEKCAKLSKLHIDPCYKMYNLETDSFLQQFYETEFFTSSPKCIFTLTHLTLNRFRAIDSKYENFKNFKILESITYPSLQQILNYNSSDQGFGIDMNLWPGFKLLNANYYGGYGVEFKRN